VAKGQVEEREKQVEASQGVVGMSGSDEVKFYINTANSKQENTTQATFRSEMRA